MNSINQVKNAISAFAAMDPSLTHAINQTLDCLSEALDNAGFDEEEVDGLEEMTESLVKLMEDLTSEQIVDEATIASVIVAEKEEKEFIDPDDLDESE